MSDTKFNKDLPFNDLGNLPPAINLESTVILKATIRANKLLAELKGFCQTLPNPDLLLNTIVLQESKESNAIQKIEKRGLLHSLKISRDIYYLNHRLIDILAK
jgi:Fic family protein